MEDPLVIAVTRRQLADVHERLHAARAVADGFEGGPALLAGAGGPKHELRAGGELLRIELRAHAKAPVEKELEAADGGTPATAGRGWL
jgi:hypothetical protein